MANADAIARIREQYPEYADIPDQDLVQRIVAKFPMYQDLFESPRQTVTGEGGLRGAVERTLAPVVGPLVAGVAKAVAPLVAPIAGSIMGAAAGAPLGLPGMVLGAGAGAAGGGGLNVIGEDVARMSESQAPLSSMQALGEMGEQFAGGAGGQALGMGLGAGLKLMQGGVTKLRKLIDLTAQGHGIELTAGEKTGSRAVGFLERITQRSLGAGPFEAMGRRQASQLTGAFERTLGTTMEEAGDTAARSNTFKDMLVRLRTGFKDSAKQSFGTYAKHVGGLDSPMGPDDFGNLLTLRDQLAADVPIWSSLRNTRLGSILDDIAEMQAGMTEQIKMRPAAEAAIRKMMGLSADEPLTAANLPLNDPALKGLFEVVPPKLPTLGQIRAIRSKLGDLAFPDRAAGAITDPMTKEARMLWGALADDLEAHALKRGGQPALDALHESNQMYATSLENLDKKMYATLLSGAKDLPAFSKELFNPRNPRPLLDAKATLSDEGWQMLQQQYADDVLVSGGVVKPLEGGGFGFNGKALSDRLYRDKRILDILHPPETVKALMELADVARVASSTSNIVSDGVIGIMISAGQGAALAHGITSGSLLKTTAALIPYGFSKIATNPMGIRLLTGTIRAMNAGRNAFTGDAAQTITSIVSRGATSAGASLSPLGIQTPGMAND